MRAKQRRFVSCQNLVILFSKTYTKASIHAQKCTPSMYTTAWSHIYVCIFYVPTYRTASFFILLTNAIGDPSADKSWIIRERLEFDSDLPHSPLPPPVSRPSITYYNSCSHAHHSGTHTCTGGGGEGTGAECHTSKKYQ